MEKLTVEEAIKTFNISINTTKDSGHQIGESIKDILTKVDRLKNITTNPPIKVKYKNWKGETGIRTIIPAKVWYGHTDYHLEAQWLMGVWDVEKDAMRTYAMMDILEFIKE